MLVSNFEHFLRLRDPWEELEHMRRAVFGQTTPSNTEFPEFNVWASGDNVVVTTELPGVDRNAIEISVEGTTLTVKGSRDPEQLAEGDSYHRRERWSGQFFKTFELPFTIDDEKVKAQFAKGVLEINLPRAEAEKSRKIEIKSE